MPKSGQAWVPHFNERSPFFEPFSALGRDLAARPDWPSLDDYTALVRDAYRRHRLDLPPLKFAASAPRPRRRRPTVVTLSDVYDGSIVLNGCVPCVPQSYHDLFNALIFAALPRSKYALHRRQFEALQARVPAPRFRMPPTRSREQDALTVFDEGGSVLVVSQSFLDSWSTKDEAVLLDPIDDQSRLIVFGHALLEHIFYGRCRIRSCAVILVRDADFATTDLLTWTDERVSRLLVDRSRFQAPGADGVVRVEEDGRAWLEAM